MMWFLVLFVWSAPSPSYYLTERALDACPYSADPFAVQRLIELENQAGFPPEARGLLPAVWCVETHMTQGKARGDHGAAKGPVQGHPWLWKWCGMAGGGWDDLEAAYRCYAERIVYRAEGLARAKCPGTEWAVAEAVTANYPRYGWNCNARSDHWKAMTK